MMVKLAADKLLEIPHGKKKQWSHFETNCTITCTHSKQWRSQGGKVMWALLGHIAKGKGNV